MRFEIFQNCYFMEHNQPVDIPHTFLRTLEVLATEKCSRREFPIMKSATMT